MHPINAPFCVNCLNFSTVLYLKSKVLGFKQCSKSVIIVFYKLLLLLTILLFLSIVFYSAMASRFYLLVITCKIPLHGLSLPHCHYRKAEYVLSGYLLWIIKETCSFHPWTCRSVCLLEFWCHSSSYPFILNKGHHT